MNVPAFLAAAEPLGLHSLVVLHRGETIASRWLYPYAPERVHQLYSLSKSFTSTAVGLAAAEGRLALSDNVIAYFPDDLPEEISENLAAMTIHDLLCMASGHTIEPWGQGDNWARNFLAAPIEKRPGTHFLYNSLATYMVAAILARATGESLLEYLRPRLLDPLGIEKATWESCPRGIQVGGWGLSITTDSIARFGELYRLDGVWRGKRLLPEGWVELATRSHISNGDPSEANDWSQGYGYQFWRCRHGAYRGDGAFGQFCVVLPEQELVVAATAGTDDMQAILNALWASVGVAPLPPVRGEISHPTGASDSPWARSARYVCDDNEAQITDLSLTFGSEGVDVAFSDRWGSHLLPVGINRWRVGETTHHPARTEVQPTAAWGAWTAPNVFSFRLCYIEHPATPLYTLTFAGETLCIERVGHLGIGSAPNLTVKARRE